MVTNGGGEQKEEANNLEYPEERTHTDCGGRSKVPWKLKWNGNAGNFGNFLALVILVTILVAERPHSTTGRWAGMT